MESAARPVWIDPSWLSWEPWWDCSLSLLNDTARHYEIHQHACDRLTDDANEFDRADAIMALRRAVGQRVRMLIDTYQLRKLSIGTKPKHDLELLSYLGIIRPFMLKRLIDIRNFVEHQDSSPPPTEQCLMFADLVWYFLRSTDVLVRMPAERIIFYPPGTDIRSPDAQVVLDFCGIFNESPRIEARLHPSGFIYEPKANWMRIEASEIIRNEEPETSHLAVSGWIHGTDEQMKLMYELYFRCSHFR